MSTRTPPDLDHAIHVTRDPRPDGRRGLHHRRSTSTAKMSSRPVPSLKA